MYIKLTIDYGLSNNDEVTLDLGIVIFYKEKKFKLLKRILR